MKFQAMFCRDVAHGLHVSHIQGVTAAEVMGVFEHDQPAAGEMNVVRPDSSTDFIQGQGAVGSVGNRARMDAPHGGGSALLEKKSVRQASQDDFIAAFAVGQQTDQVAHGAAGHKQRGLFPHPFGRHFLQLVDGRVFAEDIITDPCFGHGLAHGRCRPGQGVGSQVNNSHYETPWSWIFRITSPQGNSPCIETTSNQNQDRLQALKSDPALIFWNHILTIDGG